MELKATNKKEFVLCWQKLDRKSKKVNFLISQTNQHYEDKATASTIDEIGAQIENLQFKLDEISMNIASQVETEKVHYDCKYTRDKILQILTRVCSFSVQ